MEYLEALSYIRFRKAKIRYATHCAANLPIGSGAIESTCWSMQQRQALRANRGTSLACGGILAMRALVLSDRWFTAWQPYAATHRKTRFVPSHDQDRIRLDRAVSGSDR